MGQKRTVSGRWKIKTRFNEKKNRGDLCPNLPFPDVRGPNFECQRTIEAIRASIKD